MMAEHTELVGEIGVIEKMTTTERLKHAKKRRQAQLRKYSQYEKNVDKELSKKKKAASKRQAKKGAGGRANNNNVRRVNFVSSVMLLEAAARNDIEEGEWGTSQSGRDCGVRWGYGNSNCLALYDMTVTHLHIYPRLQSNDDI